MINVLIVEDDPMVAELNRMFLKEIEGFEVKAMTPTVKEAIEIISKEKIQLILLDVFMPEQNGFSLLSYIRKKQLDIDVILVTAAHDMQSIHKALQNGAADYIIKPFQFDRFREALVGYREKAKLIGAQKEVTQEELDRLLLPSKKEAAKKHLPKGLTVHTMTEIRNFLLGEPGTEFSTEDISEQLGISRVSVKKYLNFLEELNVVESVAAYGSIGRPLTKYRFQQKNEDLLKPYLQDNK